MSPDAPQGALSEQLAGDLDRLAAESAAGSPRPWTIGAVGGHGDPRVAWLLVDVLRFESATGPATAALVGSLGRLLGVELPVDDWPAAWKRASDLLIAWDLPSYPGYRDHKRRLFASRDAQWGELLADPRDRVDWRLVTWGGVFPDDRDLGVLEGCPRGCIPALDDPVVTDAAGGDWLGDGRVVFGVVIGGAARAYPKHQMEAHELVLDTLGGRRIALPYCTLCASAQAYFVDELGDEFEPPVLRTTGLLVRSNKLMVDRTSRSLVDTFTGEALSGPLRAAEVTFAQATVVTTTWGEWRRAHPATTVVAEDGGVGRSYDFDLLGGRDDDGPIFPVGAVDPRLGVQVRVVGVATAAGGPVAFPVSTARRALSEGQAVELGGVRLALDGGGLTAFDREGRALACHESFWFAWSQFHPETLLWR